MTEDEVAFRRAANNLPRGIYPNGGILRTASGRHIGPIKLAKTSRGLDALLEKEALIEIDIQIEAYRVHVTDPATGSESSYLRPDERYYALVRLRDRMKMPKKKTKANGKVVNIPASFDSEDMIDALFGSYPIDPSCLVEIIKPKKPLAPVVQMVPNTLRIIHNDLSILKRLVGIDIPVIFVEVNRVFTELGWFKIGDPLYQHEFCPSTKAEASSERVLDPRRDRLSWGDNSPKPDWPEWYR